MRISEQALEQIIKEEVQTALLELAPLPGAVKSPPRPVADPKALVKAPPELSKRPVPKWYLDSWIKAGKPEKGSTKWHVWFNTARSQARAAASKPPAKGQQAYYDLIDQADLPDDAKGQLRRGLEASLKRKTFASGSKLMAALKQAINAWSAALAAHRRQKAIIAADPGDMAGQFEKAIEKHHAPQKAAATGVELFGRGARCPKCTYAKEGGKYYITAPSGKKVRASRRQTRQLVRALRRRK